MKKALVVGVILLFLGVGVQPALANEISITNTSVDEDCGCQDVNRLELLRFKLLLIRLEILINSRLSKYNHIVEVTENYQEIHDRILKFRVMNDIFILESKLEDGNLLLKCISLFMLTYSLLFIAGFFFGLSEKSGNPKIKEILDGIACNFLFTSLYYWDIFAKLECLPYGPDE